MDRKDGGGALDPHSDGLQQAARVIEAWPREGDPAAYVPLVYADRVSVAAFARDGGLLRASPHFPALQPEEIRRLTRLTLDHGEVQTRLAETAEGEIRPLAVAPVAQSRRWALGEVHRAILETENAAVGAMSVSPLHAGNAVETAARALGLTGRQSLLVAALARHGDLARAARELGVSYATARDALAEAMARAGVRRRALLVRRAASLALGLIPGDDEAARVEDVFGLSRRQAVLALSLAQGAARGEAAAAAGMSEAAAKKELSAVFLQTGVASATELTGRITEAAALAALAAAAGGPMPLDDVEPLRLLARPQGGVVAVSDYGPKRGRPVLMLHSSSAARAAPRVLVAALHQRGFRPIAIDRPGFGLTDPMPAPGPDPFDDACADLEHVCETLDLGSVSLLARGGAQVAAHFLRLHRDRVERAVLAAPDPATRTSGSGKGALKVIKQVYRASPELIEPVARLLVKGLSTQNMQDFVFRAVADSPVDVAIMRDRRHFADYARGFLPFLSGRVGGYLSEQLALATLPDPPVVEASHGVHLMIGAHDPLHDARECAAYWSHILPRATHEIVADAGRFLIYSHAEAVADALRGADPGAD
ncbi:MAG: alpha/beta fold hydrolase [Oceanicaulis sp.]